MLRACSSDARKRERKRWQVQKPPASNKKEKTRARACVCACVRACMRACVRVCACARARVRARVRLHCGTEGGGTQWRASSCENRRSTHSCRCQVYVPSSSARQYPSSSPLISSQGPTTYAWHMTPLSPLPHTPPSSLLQPPPPLLRRPVCKLCINARAIPPDTIIFTHSPSKPSTRR